jgi:LacI family transcriptional regulator
MGRLCFLQAAQGRRISYLRNMATLKRVTHAEIAAKAGCHQTTVSMALRRHPKLNSETAERIRNIATKMGHVPDPMLSALASYRSGQRPRAYQQTMAVLCNRPSAKAWEEYPTGASTMRGLRVRAAELGFRVESFAIHPKALSPERFMKIAEARNLRGLILASTDYGQPRIELDWSQFSVVALGFSIETPAFHRVGTNCFQTARQATLAVVKHGFKRIGLVHFYSWDRRQAGGTSGGFLQVAGQYPEKAFATFGVFPPYEWGEDSFVKWYESFKPDAILGCGAQVELWLEALVKKKDRAVAVNLELCEPDGTKWGMAEHTSAMGQAAAEVLSGLLARNEKGVPDLAREILIEGTWVGVPSRTSAVEKNRSS